MRTLQRDSSRRRTSTPSTPASRTQSFTCSTELLRAFEHRTFELGCSFDWLLEEAMQRLLADASEERRSPPPESAHQMKPGTARLLPPPPDATPSTLPPPPPTRARVQPAAPPPAPSQRSRTATAMDEPLVLDYGRDWLVIDRHPFVIGRSPSLADLVIDDGAVSRRHAVIEHTADGWVITDLDSTNGIIVDGEVVRHAVLRAGVVMSIGPMTFAVTAP